MVTFRLNQVLTVACTVIVSIMHCFTFIVILSSICSKYPSQLASQTGTPLQRSNQNLSNSLAQLTVDSTWIDCRLLWQDSPTLVAVSGFGESTDAI